METRLDRYQTLTLWQIVMSVTCVEAYLQDVLIAAASIDPELMSKSEQSAPYADVIAATSLEALANELRARWARNWLSDGGPRRWISRLAGTIQFERVRTVWWARLYAYKPRSLASARGAPNGALTD
jgi:hypothetical protein